MMRDNHNREGVINLLLIMIYLIEDLESHKGLEFKGLYEFCVNNAFIWLGSLREKSMVWNAISIAITVNKKLGKEILLSSVS